MNISFVNEETGDFTCGPGSLGAAIPKFDADYGHPRIVGAINGGGDAGDGAALWFGAKKVLMMRVRF
jgi:hypothetical protein